MNTKITTLIFCLLFLVTTAFAASEAEYRKLDKTYKLNADGSQEFRCSMELTLFTHTAMNGTYGESFIVYDPRYQELQIHSSYTVQKDGTVIETPQNAFVEVLPRNAADAPAYNHLKEMVVVHTGLELGATIFLDYSILSKPGYLPALDVYDEPLQTSPVRELTYTVIVPESSEPSFAIKNCSAQMKTRTANGMKTSSWTLRQLPAASRNGFASAAYGDIPFFTATTFKSDKEALGTLYKQFNSLKDPQIETVAEGIVEGKNTDTEKLEAILKYINNELGSSRLSLSETGFRLRPADAVINTAYGTGAEKVNLLNGMLNAIGIPAEPVALYRVNAGTVCGLNAVNELFVITEADGKQYLLSPGSNRMATAGFMDGIVPSVSLVNGEKKTFATPETNIEYTVEMTLSPDKADAEITSKTGRAQRPYFVADKGTHTSSQPLKADNGYVLVTLPDAPSSLANSHFCRMNSTRQTNLMMPCKADEQYRYSIRIPEGMSLQTPVISKTITNGAGKFVYSVGKNGNTVHVTRSLQLNKQLFTPAGYKELRTLLTEWGDANQKVVLFSIK